MSETDGLVQKREKNSDSKESKSKVKWRHLIGIPAILLLFTFSSISSYTINEWTQQKCVRDYFENTSLATKRHSCVDVNETLTEKDKHDSVQHDTSLWSLYYRLAEYLPMLLSTLLYPSLSDAYGRKFLVTLTSFSALLTIGVSTAVIYFNGSQWYIVIVSAIEGFTGGLTTFICAIFAITADITTSDERVFGIVLIEMVCYIAVTISSILSGTLIETLSLGFFNTGLICSSAVLLSCLLLAFVLPETLSEDRRRKMSVMKAIMRPFTFYTGKEFRGRRRGYILLLLTFSLCALSMFGRSELETIYLLGRPFCFGPADIGYFISARHATGSIIGMGSLKLFLKCLSNEAVTLLSITSTVGSYVLEGFAQSTTMLYMVSAAGTLSLLCFPMIRGIMSSITSPDMQGSIFASAGFVEALGSLIGTTFSGALYAKTVSVWPGLVFEGLAGIGVLNFISMLMYMWLKPKLDMKMAGGHGIDPRD